jgi:hypothetical protein
MSIESNPRAARRAPSPRRNPRSRREAINDVDYDRE